MPTCGHVRATPGERQWAGASTAFGSWGGRMVFSTQDVNIQAAVAKEVCRDGILHSGASEGQWDSNLGPGAPGCARC